MKIKFNDKQFKICKFKNEAELEKIVISLAKDIFGSKSIYIDTKKKIRKKNSNFAIIPDGYLLDFRNKIKLWVVENELSSHDSFNHVGIQLLKFATQFSEGSYAVKEILYEYINDSEEIQKKFKSLIKNTGFSNISETLDFAIYKNDYGFVIIIDEITEDLTRVTREIAKQPEILEVKKMVSGHEELYLYDELLKEFEEEKASKVSEEEIDTIVSPAREEGFKSAFLDQKAWWTVRISSNIINKLKYIAMYEVAPVSAIRWYGVISSIKPYEDTGRYKIYCSEIFKIGPIKLDNPKYTPQASRYTKFDLIRNANKISDIF